MPLIGQAVVLGARRTPNRAAVKERSGRARTYAELDDRTNRLAHALRHSGFERGDRVAVWMDDVIEYVELYVALAKAELVVVPINTRFTVDEAAYLVDRTGARGLVFTESVAGKAAELGSGRDWILRAAVGAFDHGDIDYEQLIASGVAASPSLPNPESPYIIAFTSGTTGFPKGAVLTQRSVGSLATTQAAAVRMPPGGVNAHTVTMSFCATVTAHILPHLYVGGTSLLVGRMEADELLDLFEREQVTSTYIATPLLPEFIRAARERPETLRTVRALMHAGSKADPALLSDFADAVGERYLEGWGMTEISGGVACATSVRDFWNRHEANDFFSSVGRPVPDHAVGVIGDDGEPLPHDGTSVGELIVWSGNLMSGYWADPDATSAAIHDGWYRTGDIGSVDEQGFVYISDRRTDLIVSGGMNVYPAEVELALIKHPRVREVAVVAGPHARWGQTPVAVVVAEGEAPTSEELISFTQERLASYKKPTSVVFVDSLPKTTSEKVRKGEVREMVARILAKEADSP